MEEWIYVVEFQKRSLPHAHSLLILISEESPKSEDEYDFIVPEEIPDQKSNQDSFDVIS
jgi:hypothetical protein